MAMSKFRKKLIEALGGYTTPTVSLQEPIVRTERLNVKPYRASYHDGFPSRVPSEVIKRGVKNALIGELWDAIEVHQKEKPEGMLYWAEINVVETKGE